MLKSNNDSIVFGFLWLLCDTKPFASTWNCVMAGVSIQHHCEQPLSERAEKCSWTERIFPLRGYFGVVEHHSTSVGSQNQSVSKKHLTQLLERLFPSQSIERAALARPSLPGWALMFFWYLEEIESHYGEYQGPVWSSACLGNRLLGNDHHSPRKMPLTLLHLVSSISQINVCSVLLTPSPGPTRCNLCFTLSFALCSSRARRWRWSWKMSTLRWKPERGRCRVPLLRRKSSLLSLRTCWRLRSTTSAPSHWDWGLWVILLYLLPPV